MYVCMFIDCKKKSTKALVYFSAPKQNGRTNIVNGRLFAIKAILPTLLLDMNIDH